MIFFSMLILGALIGFVGAGGAGVVITLLTVGFDVPIHTALGVALALWSHSRDAALSLSNIVGMLAAGLSRLFPGLSG